MCDNPLCDIEHDDNTLEGELPSMGDGAQQSSDEAPALPRQTARQIAARFGAASVFNVITAAATALRLR